MIKKYSKLFALTFLAFFVSMISANAKLMDYKELGKAVLAQEPDAGYVYVVGGYAFTSEIEIFNIQDVMLAASDSIESTVPVAAEEDALINLARSMTIYEIRRTSDGWTVAANLMGNGTAFNEDAKVDIQYIDYKYMALDSNFTVTLDKYTSNGYTYTDKNENMVLSDDGKLIGLLIKNTVGEFGFPEGSEYFFSFKVDIPDYEAGKTTISIARGEHNRNYAQSDLEDDALYILAYVDPTKIETEHSLVITVDIDGEGKVYEPKTYTIDWSDVDFQTVSEVTVDGNYDVEDLKGETFGYTRTEEDTYAPRALTESEKSSHSDWDYIISGKVAKNTVSDNAFGADKANGWFMAYNINLPQITDENVDKAVIKISCAGCDGGYKTITKDALTKNADGTYSLTMLNLIANTAEELATANDKVIEIKVDVDGNENAYLEETIKIGLALTYTVNSENEISTFEETKNDFYTTSYENGVMTVNMDITDFTSPESIQGTGIISSIKKLLETGDYSEIVTVYNSKDYKYTKATKDSTTSTFNSMITAMINNKVVNLAGNKFTIKFVPATPIQDVSSYKEYDVKFNITVNTEKEIQKYLTNLNPQDLFTTEYEAGVITITLNSNKILEAAEGDGISGTKIFANAADILKTGRYSTITVKADKNYTFTANETSDQIFAEAKNMLAAMIKENFDITLKEITVKFNTMSDDIKDVSSYKEYTVKFEIITDTNAAIDDVVDEIQGTVDGQEYFTFESVKKEGKITGFNVTLNGLTIKDKSDLEKIKNTGLILALEKIMANGVGSYDTVTIGDSISYDVDDLLATLMNDISKLSDTQEKIKTDLKTTLISLMTEDGKVDIKNLKGKSIDVTIKLKDGVTDAAAENGVITYTINFDVLLMLEDKIEESVTKVNDTYYNKEENKTIEETELESTEFYVEIGECDEEELTSITIGETEYTSDKYYISVGLNSFIHASAWKVEGGKLLVAGPVLEVEAMPKKSVLIIAGENEYDVEVFDKDAEKELSIESAELVGDKDTDKKITTDGNNITVTFSYRDTALALVLKDSEGNIVDPSTIIITRSKNSIGYTTPENFGGKNITYGLYLAPYDTTAIKDEEVNKYSFTDDIKIAVVGKGVITIHLTATAKEPSKS